MSVALLLANAAFAQSQYNPKGFAEKWNVSLTPFFIIPTVSGEIESQFLTEEYGISTSQFVQTLSGMAMINAEVWKGQFFISPSWAYNKNEVDATLWNSELGEMQLDANPIYTRHIVEVKSGWRINLENKVFLDPFVGFRYTNYHLEGSLTGTNTARDFNEQQEFWDPILGFQVHYYPHPRVPLEFRSDLGGFGVGSEVTWSTFIHAGYAVAPWLDVLAGFAALSNNYEGQTRVSNQTFTLTSTTFGADVGFRFYLTGRSKSAFGQ